MYLKFLVLVLFFSTTLAAQDDNPRNDQGQKHGFWRERDARGEVWAQGRYDSDQRIGTWRFFLSPVARKTKEADMLGQYTAGTPEGAWQCTEWQSKISLKGQMQEGLMNGIWTFTDAKGNLLAKGQMQNGVRQGTWILYQKNQPMAQGNYEQGLKIGTWTYDYYPRKDVHVKGIYEYKDGLRAGKQEWYKVDLHPKFTPEEVLVGVGTYQNGKKSGKWIEYQRGYKGEVIEIGYYDGEGRRTGLWETTADGKPYQQCAYNDGKKQGAFKSFYETGQIQYQTYYEDDMETGAYVSYYENGEVRERGGHTIIEQERIEDSLYYKIELPLEFLFRYALDKPAALNYNLIDWIAQPDEVSIPQDELEKRYTEFQTYGLQGRARLDGLKRSFRQVVKVGPLKIFHENGKLRLEGIYLPTVRFESANGFTQTIFGKDGEWKEYDDLGYLRKIYIYEDGKQIKVLDDKRREIPK